MHRICEIFQKQPSDTDIQPSCVPFENFPSTKIPMFSKKTRNFLPNTPKNPPKHNSLKNPRVKMPRNPNENYSNPSPAVTNCFIPVLKLRPKYFLSHKRNLSLNFTLVNIRKQEKVSYINIEPLAITENTLKQVMSANNSTKNNKMHENKFLHRFFRHQSEVKSRREVKTEDTKEKLDTSKESDIEITSSILKDCENIAYQQIFDSWEDESPEKERFNILKPRFQF